MTAANHTTPPGPVAMVNTFWLLPIGAAVGCLLFVSGQEGPLAQQAFIGAMWGAFGAVPLVIVSAFVLVALRHLKTRAAEPAQQRKPAGDAGQGR